MEESEKRKERLRAMHSGSLQQEPPKIPFDSAAPVHLLNPLAQPSAASSGVEKSPTSSRFDYYTDPMSAYSGNKKRCGTVHHPSGGFSSPVHGRSPTTHLSSPPSAGQVRGYITPISVPTNFFQGSCSPHPRPYATPSPVPHPWRSPAGMGRAGPFPVQNSARFCGSSSASGPPRGYSWGYASPERSPATFNSGRSTGRQPGNYRSPCSGRGGRGGRWSKEVISARECPGKFFDKTMLSDPWDNLEPVVGCILQPLGSPKSWLPESIRAKKAKVLGTPPVSGSPQGSLAEYIAKAFEEAANEDETSR